MTDNELRRFWAKVAPDSSTGCWRWTGCKTGITAAGGGYGTLTLQSRPHKKVYAHRLSFAHYKNPIPAGLTIDHKCKNTACVNPAHLEAVTLKVNILRGSGAGAINAVKTHCKRGHLFDKANTGRNQNGGRFCRTCAQASQRRMYWHHKRTRRAKRALAIEEMPRD